MTQQEFDKIYARACEINVRLKEIRLELEAATTPEQIDALSREVSYLADENQALDHRFHGTLN